MNEIRRELVVKLAPYFVKKAGELVERVSKSGGDPQNIRIEGRTIRDAYSVDCVLWANSIADAYEKSTNAKTK